MTVHTHWLRAFWASPTCPGFTLVELLVVAASVTAMAGVLLPVFAQAREKAHAAACLSNTKKLAIAIIQYEQDDACSPRKGANRSGLESGWAGQIYPYVTSRVP